jgi:hypothetical protein
MSYDSVCRSSLQLQGITHRNCRQKPGKEKEDIIQPSAVQIAKLISSGIEKEDDADDQDYSLDTEDNKSRGQSKRKSL